MRKRTLEILQRQLRGQVLKAASRLVPTAEDEAKKGKPHLFRVIARLSGTQEPPEPGREAAGTRPPETPEELQQQLVELVPDAIQQARRGKPALLRALALTKEAGLGEPGEPESETLDTTLLPRPDRSQPTPRGDGVTKPIDTNTESA